LRWRDVFDRRYGLGVLRPLGFDRLVVSLVGQVFGELLYGIPDPGKPNRVQRATLQIGLCQLQSLERHLLVERR
jgi:hypothetical protein